MICQAAVVDAQGTVLLDVVVDQDIPYDHLLNAVKGHSLATNTVRKFYDPNRKVICPMATKQELVSELSTFFYPRDNPCGVFQQWM